MFSLYFEQIYLLFACFIGYITRLLFTREKAHEISFNPCRCGGFSDDSLRRSPCGNGKPASANAKAASAASKPAEAAAVSNKNVPDDVAKTITSKLESRYADRKLKVEEIAAAPVAGWYEVVVNGKNLVYVDASAEYMLVGDLISTQDGKSLTEERKAVLNKIDYDKLPFDKAIKEVRGNGKLQVAVFSDPDCPFCKKLEHEFGKMTDITIYNFMMPIPQLHPDAARKAVQIMCQPNTTKAWIEWMREGKMPASVAECKTPLPKPPRWARAWL